jgi:hypothetical protein
MAREGRMIDAVTNTGRNLPWIDNAEGKPFELPRAYQ